jgi:hypothetical protein
VAISDKKLLELNALGLFPAPNETVLEFNQRVLDFKSSNEIKKFDKKDKLKWHDFDWAISTVNQLFDISPDWVSAYFSNKELRFWQGGVTLISSTGKPPLILQLRKQLKKGKYLFLYEKDEILSHELVHAARCCFNEPKTEEILAYWTSTSHLRKLFGPIFRNSLESNIFMAMVSLEVFLQVLLPIYCFTFFVIFFYLSTFTMFAFLTFRLFRTRSKVNLTLKKLKIILNSKKKAMFVLFRLTDNEIYSFSKSSTQNIIKYINKQKQIEFRWKVIESAYFKNVSF